MHHIIIELFLSEIEFRIIKWIGTDMIHISGSPLYSYYNDKSEQVRFTSDEKETIENLINKGLIEIKCELQKWWFLCLTPFGEKVLAQT